MSALAFASCVKQLEVMRVLIQLGAKVNETRKRHHAPSVTAAFDGFAEGLKLLKDQGCQLALEDSTGLAPVHAAADQGHLSILYLLQSSGVPMDSKGVRGRCTPADWATQAGHTDCAQFLLTATTCQG
jgi:ankyrin repeat protein